MKTIKECLRKRTVLFLGICCVIIIKALLSVGLAVILQQLIDSFNNITMESVVEDIKFILIFIVSFVLIQIIYNYLAATIERRVLSDVKEITIKSILKLSIANFRHTNTANYISLLTNHIEDLEKDLLNSWITLIDMTVMLIFSIVMLFWYNPIIGLVSLFATMLSLCIPVCLSNYGNKLKLNYSKKQEELTKFTKDLLNGFNLIKEYKVESNIEEKYSKKNKDVEFWRYKYNFTLGIIMGISMFLGYIIFFSVILVGLILSINNNITVGCLIACVNLSNSLVNPVMNGLQQIFRIKAIKGIAEKFDIKQEEITKGKNILDSSIEKIELINVSYNYESARGVNNISLCFEKGKKYLIVGTSGSGKSTLIKLLSGYFEDFDGKVLINKDELRSIEEESLHKKYSIVNQDSFLFDGTIEDNIRFFQNIDDDLMSQVIQLTELTEIINCQNNNINTEVGEDGNKVSGGEKQRISLARALARDNEILLLDESTGNLDNKMALAIEKNILKTDKMVISVSHRIIEEIASNYNEIIVINDGRVVENGSFEELINKQGYFYSLYYLQNKH